MRGRSAAQDEVADDGCFDTAADAAHDLESKIIGDIARELENNNVNKMARDIFSFYICVRWVPDETFWQLAGNELAAEVTDVMKESAEQASSDDASEAAKPEEVVLGEAADAAVVEMYRAMKFVPLLCSRNLEVFSDEDVEDKTSFTAFRRKVERAVAWLDRYAGEDYTGVGRMLRELDAGVLRDGTLSALRGMLGFSTAKMPDAQALRSRFAAVNTMNATDARAWKQEFPYHSFIAKGEAAPRAPAADQRFVVCFGKRVASELHRRPEGRHILADQNNVGCHGWYSARETGKQLRRILELWKPPTCQLATMTYEMKRDILEKFREMNERLFDALPSVINDELKVEEDDAFNWRALEATPLEAKPLVRGKFVEGMPVRSVRQLLWCNFRRAKDAMQCADGEVALSVGPGERGEFRSGDGGKLLVAWSEGAFVRSLAPRLPGLPPAVERDVNFEVSEEDIDIWPHSWRAKRGFGSALREAMDGVTHITAHASTWFDSIFSRNQQDLANLMSGSVSKWAVCPIRGEKVEVVDEHLGTEDAAFEKFQEEAYRKWTGRKGSLPGEVCDLRPSEVLDISRAHAFEGAKLCPISDLQAEHVERYPQDNEFVCPLVPPLSAGAQLRVLSEKRRTCFLRMTGLHQQRADWHYRGRFPARRQYDRRENAPQTQYELVKLIEVDGDEAQSVAKFGRMCSLEELRANPRFCNLPEVFNPWLDLEEYARVLSDSVEGVLLGKPARAFVNALTDLRGQLGAARNASVSAAAEAAMVTASRAFAGLGRLVGSTATRAVAHVLPEFPGARRMRHELDLKIFGAGESGEVLHSMSFQRVVTAKRQFTTNDKARFQRYVAAFPCASFDPAKEYALRDRWQRVAVQMLVEAMDATGGRILQAPSLSLRLRGEGLVFKEPDVPARGGRPARKGSAHAEFQASMEWMNPIGVPDCSTPPGQKSSASNASETLAGRLTTGLIKAMGRTQDPCGPRVCDRLSAPDAACVPRGRWAWLARGVSKLAGVAAPLSVPGSGLGLEELRGLDMSLYCAPKLAFGSTGPPTRRGVEAQVPLAECLEAGWRRNALAKWQEPWRLYFPDEVVVIAIFAPVKDRSCAYAKALKDRAPAEEAGICDGSNEDDERLRHLVNDQGSAFVFDGRRSQEFLGVRSGAGLPTGTLKEVFFKPEDVLEALELIGPSHGR